MFANTFQKGFVSIFYSVGSSPLQLWDKQVKNGHIRRVVDEEVKSLVLEISGTNVATTYITCPIKPRLSLGIRLPFLVMIIKNMKKYFTFEIQILDDKDMHRRFRVSNFQSTTKVRPFCTTMPIGLSSGWNQVQFNLADFTKRAYGSTYIETTRVQVHANVRIRRIYFSDVLYSDDEMPNEYKLFVPTPGTQSASRNVPGKKTSVSKEAPPRRPSQASADKMKIEVPEQEVPSAAFPSPIGEDERQDSPQESPLESIPEVSTTEEGASEFVEPPSEGVELTTTGEETTEAPSESMPVETPSEAAGEEGTTTAEVSEGPKTEETAPEESTKEGEAPSAEAAPAAEEKPAEETPAEPAPEEPPKEEAPAEEAPAEAPPAEEAPAEAPPAEEAPTEKAEEAPPE